MVVSSLEGVMGLSLCGQLNTIQRGDGQGVEWRVGWGV